MIFITSYDPFGKGRMVYTVRNMCVEDPNISYDDGAMTLFLNTKGKRTSESLELEKLLNYMEKTNQQNAVDSSLKKIQKMVDSVKESREAKRADMKFHEMINRERKEARREGHAEGRAEGLSEGKILGMIEIMCDDGKDNEEIISRLVSKHGVVREDAEKYLRG